VQVVKGVRGKEVSSIISRTTTSSITISISNITNISTRTTMSIKGNPISIIRDDSHYLDYSFYLYRDGITIGVWCKEDSGTQYFYYNTPIDFNQSNQRESSELEFLVLVGRTSEEMFELGMRANPGITMEVGKGL
jgi:hypothetical protein